MEIKGVMKIKVDSEFLISLANTKDKTTSP